MADTQAAPRAAEPDSTAVRVALWRAMHVEVDPPLHVLVDEIGVRLAAPGDGWRRRGDMDPQATSMYRAGMVARARFVEDLVVEQAGHGVDQYVILGAGLDTFAQRRPEIASRLRVFEIDQPGPQAWKRQRLTELGYDVPDWLRLVPVDFEAGTSWWEQLAAAGFDADRPAVVASAGVSMYLTKDANAATLRRLASLAPGSTLAMTFLLPRRSSTNTSARDSKPRETAPARAAHPSAASMPRRKCWHWPATQDSETSGTCRRPCSTSDTSRTGPTVSGRRVGRSCW
jgi:methyltransferase (TIGR00027 family)